jgi:hypothetical protein
MGDLDLKRSPVLDAAVSEYVVARDELGLAGERDDFTEDGLTDFDYICDDLTGVEMISIGRTVSQDAGTREVWYTHDGVGLRLFFGNLDEILARVARKMEALRCPNLGAGVSCDCRSCALQVKDKIAEKACENPKYSVDDLRDLVLKATGKVVPGDRDDVLEELDVDECRKVLRQMYSVD